MITFENSSMHSFSNVYRLLNQSILQNEQLSKRILEMTSRLKPISKVEEISLFLTHIENFRRGKRRGNKYKKKKFKWKIKYVDGDSRTLSPHDGQAFGFHLLCLHENDFLFLFIWKTNLIMFPIWPVRKGSIFFSIFTSINFTICITEIHLISVPNSTSQPFKNHLYAHLKTFLFS